MAYQPEHFKPKQPKAKAAAAVKKPRKTHIFGILMLILFTILMAASVYVWKIEWQFLESYEKNHIKHAEASFMDKYRLNDIDAIIDEKSIEYDKFNDRDDYLKYVYATFGNDFTDAKSIKGQINKEGAYTYNVYLGNLRFSRYELSPDGEKDKFGQQGWKCTAVDLTALNEELFVKTHGFKVCVQKGAKVYADGIQIGSDMLSAEEYTIKDYDDLDDKSLIPQFEIYEAKNIFLNEPVMTVTDQNGKEMKLTEEKGMLYALPVPDEALLDEVKAFAEKSSLAYAMYITQDAPFEDAEQYIVKDSEFLRRIKGFWHDWYRSHTVSYDNLEFSDIVMYDEEHFVLNIAFDYHVNIGYKVNDYEVEYRLSLIKLDGEWKIATMIM